MTRRTASCSAFPILPKARDHCTSARLGAQPFAFGCGLVGNLRVMRAVRQALDCTCSTIPERGGGWITERPAAHGLPQLHDRHAFWLRRDHFDWNSSHFELCGGLLVR